MDDSEYYKKMREGYSHYSFLFNKKKNSTNKVDTNTTHKQWETFQGREDAQMLQEKTNDVALQNNESLTEES